MNPETSTNRSVGSGYILTDAPPAHQSRFNHCRSIFRRADWLAAAGYTVLAAIFYAPLLLGRYTFPDGDFTHHFLPFSLFQRSELLAGRLPIWNPYTYAGHPFLADVQAAVFYPVSNLVLLLSLPWESAAARLYWLQVEAAVHVALAGIFTYLLVRALTQQRIPAVLAGIAFAFSGYLTGYPPLQVAVLRTAIWLPLILWLLWRAFASPAKWRWWIAAAGAYAVAFLAGHPQTFFFLSHVVAGWMLLLSAYTWRRHGLVPVLSHVAGFGAIFLGLSAVQLWPSWEFTQLSVRARTEYDFLSGGFPIDDTWQLLLPGVLTEFSPLYVGGVGLGLALFALIAFPITADLQRRREDAPASPAAVILFWVAITTFFLLISYGRNGFLYRVIYDLNVPGWRLFRGQERAAYVVTFGLCLLAGYGAALLPVAGVRLRRAWGAGLVLLTAAGALLYGRYWQAVGRTDISQERFYTTAGLAVLFAILFAAVVWARDLGRRRLLALALILVVDLFVANYTTNLVAGTPAERTATPPEIAALTDALARPSTVNVGIAGRIYNEYRVFLDYGMRYDVEDVWGSSPLRLARYAALFEEFPLDRMWRLTGVEYTLTWRRELFEPSELLAEFPQDEDTTYLHRLIEPNPRAWIVTKTRAADDATAVRLLADHGFDLETTAIVPTTEGSGTLAPVGDNTIEIQRLGPNRLYIDVQSEEGGLLVISENWMPGWQAIDAATGESLPIVRTNLSFLGVEVPAGERTVELRYLPDSIRYGMLVTGLTILVLIVGAGYSYSSRRSNST